MKIKLHNIKLASIIAMIAFSTGISAEEKPILNDTTLTPKTEQHEIISESALNNEAKYSKEPVVTSNTAINKDRSINKNNKEEVKKSWLEKIKEKLEFSKNKEATSVKQNKR